jgi:hypothetical protein
VEEDCVAGLDAEIEEVFSERRLSTEGPFDW